MRHFNTFLFGLIFLNLLLWGIEASAQYVPIPDLNFGQCIYFQHPSCFNNGRLDTTCAASVTSLNCSNHQISDVSCLEFFKGLQTLDLSHNNISSISSLASTINSFNCSYNQLGSIPTLPLGITNLDCSHNSVNSLPPLPLGIDSLNCSANQISGTLSLPTNLKYADCSVNSFTALSSLPSHLTALKCSDNQIAGTLYLDSDLLFLDCSNNYLTDLYSIPLGINNLNCLNNKIRWGSFKVPASIQNLNCSYNRIDTLVFDSCLYNGHISITCSNDSLVWVVYNASCNLQASLLDFSYNNLAAFPVIPFAANILYFDCSHNQLVHAPLVSIYCTYFNCSYNNITAITQGIVPLYCSNFNCSHNLISSLDFNNTGVTSFLCDLNCGFNDLTRLTTYGVNNFRSINCRNNPNLKCLSKLPLALQQLYFDSTGIICLPPLPSGLNTVSPQAPLCDFINNNGCNYYYNISGLVYYDSNSNCVLDSGERLLGDIRVVLRDPNGNFLQATHTASDGQYAFITDSGNYIVAVDTSAFASSCPDSCSHNIYLSDSDIMVNQNFGLFCKPHCNVKISSILGGPSGNRLMINANDNAVVIKANSLSMGWGISCDPGLNGDLILTMHGPVRYTSTPIGFLPPDSTYGNTLVWHNVNFNILNPDSSFEFYVAIDSSAQIHDYVYFTAILSQQGCSNGKSTDTLNSSIMIGTPHDPNSKEADPFEVLHVNDQWLLYTLHFQNTGTAPARNIVVLDTLSPWLDPGSVEITSYSKRPILQILPGAVLKFNFPDINLPEAITDSLASEGYVQFRVKPQNSLPAGLTILNTGYIFFDLNQPVATNTTLNYNLCQSSGSVIDTTICVGQNIYIGPITHYQAGVYYDTLLSSLGCDSIIQLTLHIDSMPSISLIHRCNESVDGPNSCWWCTTLKASYSNADSIAWHVADLYSFNNDLDTTFLNQDSCSIGLLNRRGYCDGLANYVFYTQGIPTIYACVTAYNRCGRVSICDTISLVDEAIDEIAPDAFQVFPNPSSGNFFIKIDGSLLGCSWYLDDITGKNLDSGRLIKTPAQVEIPKIAPGVYLVQLKREGRIIGNRKMVIN